MPPAALPYSLQSIFCELYAFFSTPSTPRHRRPTAPPRGRPSPSLPPPFSELRRHQQLLASDAAAVRHTQVTTWAPRSISNTPCGSWLSAPAWSSFTLWREVRRRGEGAWRAAGRKQPLAAAAAGACKVGATCSARPSALPLLLRQGPSGRVAIHTVCLPPRRCHRRLAQPRAIPFACRCGTTRPLCIQCWLVPPANVPHPHL